MEIITKKLDELTQVEKNVRRHPEGQIKEFMRSLKQFGQIRPMVVDEKGVILIGNGLHKAMVTLGLKEGAVLVLKGLSQAQKTKLMIADNKIYELGTLDNDVLTEMLTEIGANGEFDIPGFNEEILKELFGSIDNITDSVKSYGEISEDSINSMNDKIDGNEDSNFSPDLEVKISNENIEIDNKKRAYIKCPNCQEKIWL